MTDLERLRFYPDWPAGMTRSVALAYTGVSERQLREWERSGEVRFIACGPNGAKVAQRFQIDEAVRRLFDGPGEDMRFAGD